MNLASTSATWLSLNTARYGTFLSIGRRTRSFEKAAEAFVGGAISSPHKLLLTKPAAINIIDSTHRSAVHPRSFRGSSIARLRWCF